MNNVLNQTDPNRVTVVVLDQKIIAGVDKYFSTMGKLTVGGTDFTPATLKAKLQSEIDAESALDALKAQCTQVVATTKGVRMQMRTLRAALKKYILGSFGPEALQMLADFGMTVPKNVGPRTAEAKAESQKKAAITREAKKKALASVSSASPSPTPAKA
jgi:hypothetical protein